MCTFLTLQRLVLVVLSHVLLANIAEAQNRFALLIGNQAYKESVGPLRNPHNDVALVASSLDKLGFKVAIAKDASYKSIDTALKTHIQQVRRAGKDTISFFYYSGHGASDPETRINYLIPVDVESADDANLWTNSFELNDIVSKLREQAPEATHYVVFDACRDELRLVRQGNKALGGEKGFTPVSTVTGVMIAYATAPGRTASDVGQRAGPYASALAEELSKPGVEAVTMFRNVQLKVKQTIGQDPWLSFPTLPAIYFAGKGANDDQLRQKQIETAFWESAKSSGGATLLSAYVERYPNGAYVSVARAMIRDLERKQVEEAAQVARAEHDRERARLDAEAAAREAHQAREEAARREQIAAASAAHQSLSVDAEQLKAVEQELRAAREAAVKAEAQRQAAISAVEEARTKAKKVATPRGTSTLARDIQNELKRLGCFVGDPDTGWTPKASEALARYLQAAKQTLPSEGLTAVFLERLKWTPNRTCANPCGSGERLADGKCVATAAQAPPVAAPAVRNNSRSGGDTCQGKNWVCKSIRSSKGLN
jgi:Caspase domain